MVSANLYDHYIMVFYMLRNVCGSLFTHVIVGSLLGWCTNTSFSYAAMDDTQRMMQMSGFGMDPSKVIT